MSTCDFFNCLFPLDVQNEIQLLSRAIKSLLSFMNGLFIGWLRNASLVKVGNHASFSFFTLLDV